jgi:lysophospholipase L1-like esterase
VDLRDRLVTAALVTVGVGVGVVIGGRGLLRRQAAIARAVIGKPHGEEVPDPDRTYKKRYGDRVDLLLLGDSIAAGLGVEHARETPGARLARKTAKRTHRAVRLRTGAVVGSESSDLAAQLAALPASYLPDVAVVVVGGNDVTHRVPVAESAAHLEACLRALHERGCAVVVGTCPDLGALRPVPQPLRTLGSLASRQLAAAQRAVALRHGARVVSLAAAVGPFFVADPDQMFGTDRFHPSALGYKRTADAVLPAVLAALGAGDEVPRAATGEAAS